jgi:hypothetical protein
MRDPHSSVAATATALRAGLDASLSAQAIEELDSASRFTQPLQRQ